MARISLKPGCRVQYNGAEFEIVAPTSTTKLVLSSLQDGAQMVADIAELRSVRRKAEPAKRDLHPEDYTEKQWSIARSRYKKIEPLLFIERTEEMAINRARECGVSSASLYRWMSAYEETEQLSSLIPAYWRRGGPGKIRLVEVVETLIKNYVREEYDKNPTASVNTALKDIRRQCRAAGAKAPHETTIRSRIKKYSKKAGIGNRPGRKRGDNTSAEGTFPGGRFPLDVIQIDHTKLDIMVVDETYRESIGRPFITVAIDVFSRMIFGFSIALDAPGFISTGQALLVGIMPKQKYLSKLGIESAWEIYGLPKTIHADNAQEFRSRELGIFCEEYRINLEWRPVARPKFGGTIERFIGTLNNALHDLPGTTFSNTEQRGEYKPEKHAIFTIKELEEWVTRFIVEVYHNTVHSNLGTTPRQKYESGILGDETTVGVGLPDLVDDIEKMGIFLMPAEKRTVQREGVSIDGIKYFSDVLRMHVNSADAKGRKREFLFRRDPMDTSRIFFYDPELKEYFKIPYRNLGRPPMTIGELKETKKLLGREKKLHPSEDDIFSAHERLTRIQDASAAKTKQARRSVEARKTRKADKQANPAMVSKTPAYSDELAGMPQGGWSADLFKNIQITDDISVSSSYVEVPYGED